MNNEIYEEITLRLNKTTMQRVRRAYNIYKAIPSRCQNINEGGDTFEEWISSKLKEFDQRPQRVKRVLTLLASGLNSKEIRSILNKGDGGIRCEEEDILEQADALVKDHYSYEQIKEALGNKVFRVPEINLKTEIGSYYESRGY